MPAKSVTLALTVIVPSPKVVRSPLAKVTPCAVPVPVTVLVSVFMPLVKVTSILAPLSPLTVTTPPVWIASVLVAPPLTPVPKAMTGVAATVSTIKERDDELTEVLPAASVEVAVKLCVPFTKLLKEILKLPPVAVPVPKTVVPLVS